jgi:hypothetical protein
VRDSDLAGIRLRRASACFKAIFLRRALFKMALSNPDSICCCEALGLTQRPQQLLQLHWRLGMIFSHGPPPRMNPRLPKYRGLGAIPGGRRYETRLRAFPGEPRTHQRVGLGGHPCTGEPHWSAHRATTSRPAGPGSD